MSFSQASSPIASFEKLENLAVKVIKMCSETYRVFLHCVKHAKLEGRFYCGHRGFIFALETHAFEKILVFAHSFSHSIVPSCPKLPFSVAKTD